MKQSKIIFIIALLGLVAFAQSVQAQTAAPITSSGARIAVSPYVQVVPNDSYSFLAISHPSLNTSKKSIGVAVEVLNMNTVPNNAAGRSAVFTVDAGETHRVFVVNVGNATINTSNTAFTDSRTHLIITKEAAEFGNIRIVGLNEAPNTEVTTDDAGNGNIGRNRFDNLAQLSMWGVVFIPSSGAGFSMEFIGDAHDSTIGANTTGCGGTAPTCLVPTSTTLSLPQGRGIN